MATSGDYPLLESVYLIKHSIPTKADSGRSGRNAYREKHKKFGKYHAFVQEFL